ncbi:hypothetical protein OC835_005255 [Tilletia horrida]|nr:hypothetical protein OC835_005255 [Tilletia horrida]
MNAAAVSADADVLLYATVGLPWSFGYGTRAFGGTILAVGVQAAYSSLAHRMGAAEAEQFTLFSFQGSFISPTKLTQPLRVRVTAVRDTRTFITRIVQGFQFDDNGDERNTFIATADFVRRGQPTVAGGTFSIQPKDPITKTAWQPPESLQHVLDINAGRRKEYDDGVRAGTLQPNPTTERAIYLESLLWTPISSLQEYRPLPTSPIHETTTAFDSDRPTAQDGLAVTDKTGADYIRWIESPQDLLRANPERTQASGWSLGSLHMCSLSLSLDYYLAGLAIFFAKVPRSAALFVSLDFSLRFHVADIDATRWHLREVKTVAGGEGRTFSEAAVWQDGRLVATISQQCYCKPTKAGADGRPAMLHISQSNPTDPQAPGVPSVNSSSNGNKSKL